VRQTVVIAVADLVGRDRVVPLITGTARHSRSLSMVERALIAPSLLGVRGVTSTCPAVMP
jgi:hypothetical protein